ncbi:MAG: hypothetical protein R3224_06175 [Balneolaceae bacterium]|nr:hypothetical protein [Balneolaceae bacterium]
MSSSDLTKREALKLITAVVDDEVSESVRAAFFAFIERNEDVRTKYESEKQVKRIVAERYPYAKAPDRLHRRVRNFLNAPDIDESDRTSSADKDPIYDKPSTFSDTQNPPSINTPDAGQTRTSWRYAAAAALLIATLLAGFYLYPTNANDTFNVEENAYAHFMKNGGQMIEPTIATASMGVAESRLAEVFNLPITVPVLKNTEFVGVVLTDFIPEFRAPMLEYYLPSEGQYIYIFAFNISDLKRLKKLARSKEAVKTCTNAKDFHVRNVNGKHVVSWKWGETWYTAISNHDGHTLASLVENLSQKKG